jgi:16S rRNA (guanine(966)-N(2))-methyltransferase RsmD
MRIIAGTRKGTAIAAPRGDDTRPTADKVRGAVFNMLGNVSGLKVLDLFAGSGALALESLSRGAASALMVDNRPAAVKIIAANITKLRLDNAFLKRRDYLAILKNAAKKEERFDLIFVDPPYKMLGVILPELEQWLPRVASRDARLVVESDARDSMETAFDLVTEKKYGDTRVSIYYIVSGSSSSN